MTQIAMLGPCAGAPAPTRPRERTLSWCWAAAPSRRNPTTTPTRQGPKRTKTVASCLPLRRCAPRRGATGQRLPADSEDTLTGDRPLSPSLPASGRAAVRPRLPCLLLQAAGSGAAFGVRIKRNHEQVGGRGPFVLRGTARVCASKQQRVGVGLGVCSLLACCCVAKSWGDGDKSGWGCSSVREAITETCCLASGALWTDVGIFRCSCG